MSGNFNPNLYTSKPKDVTSLDDDLSSSRSLKYDSLEKIVRPWIVKYLHDDKSLGTTGNKKLIEELKDGVVLCKLVNAIEKDYNTGAPLSIKFKESSIAFMQMENISFFLNYCVKAGVPQDELFQTVDLFEAKDPYQVLLTIQSLSRRLNGKFPQIELIGPKLLDKPAVPKKPTHLKNYTYSSKNPNWSTVEYGYMGGASQGTEGVVFGASRKL